MQSTRCRRQPCEIQALESRRLLSAVAIDLNFGVDGRVSSELRTDGGVGTDDAIDATLQSDGKILVLAHNQNNYYFLLRYNSDGTRDNSLAPHGQILLPAVQQTFYSRLHLLPNGKMLFSGRTSATGSTQSPRLILTQLNADGSLDTSFGSGGVAVASPWASPNWYDPYSSVIMPDGKILAGGSIQNTAGHNDLGAVWRFNSDGTPDNTFGTSGLVQYTDPNGNSSIGEILLDADGSFYAATSRGEGRFHSDGSVDTTFGSGGYVNNVFSYRQADGKFLSMGTRQTQGPPDIRRDLVVFRWNTDGSPDTSFGSNGSKQIDFMELDAPASLSFDSSGRIIVAAGANNGYLLAETALARLLPDGSLDPTFGSGGIYEDAWAGSGDQFGVDPYEASGTVRKALLTPQGQIVVIGTTGLPSTEDWALVHSYSNVALTRYVPDVPITFSAGPFGPALEGELFNVMDNASSYANGQIVRWEWDFGATGRLFIREAEGKMAQLRAGESPSGPVALRVTTSDGLSAIGMSEVSIINVPPVADAGPDRLAAAGVPIKLRLTGDDAAMEQGKFTVDFGDGTPAAVFDNVPFGPPRYHPQVFLLTHTYFQKGTYTLTLLVEDGDGGTSTDTTTIRVGDILANLYQDKDGNAQQHPDLDPPFPGQTIWIDLNDNGLVEAGEPSGVTDGFGDVLFDGLPLGSYAVRTQVPDGWQLVFPNRSYRGDSCGASMTETGGGKCNFALTQRGMITGTVFNDLNGNGVRDPGEPGLSGFSLLPIDSTEFPLTDTSTFNDGFYRISSLVPGDYQVFARGRAGWLQTFPAASGRQLVSVGAGQTAQNIDFGFRQMPGGSITGTVFIDVNGDGIWGPDDRPYEYGINRGARYLYVDMDNDGTRDPNELRFNARDDGTWGWIFPPGTYTIRMIPRGGWVQTYPANDAGITVTLVEGGSASNLNFGTQKVDFAAPQVNDFKFRYDLNPNRIEITFSEPVELNEYSLQVSAADGTWARFDNTGFDPSTNTAIYTPHDAASLPSQNYQAVLIAAGYQDLAGNLSGPQQTFSFFVLKGDLNRDRQVSIADFITLSSNFGKTDATYADGDMNFDGTISIADFIELAANFNKTLPAPAAAPVVAQAPAAAESITAGGASQDVASNTDAHEKNPKHPPHRRISALALRRTARHHRRIIHRGF